MAASTTIPTTTPAAMPAVLVVWCVSGFWLYEELGTRVGAVVAPTVCTMVAPPTVSTDGVIEMTDIATTVVGAMTEVANEVATA